MAIDQRNISAELRMMDDRALQQYAAMHKSDPYVFPLAFQESQNRQKIRMSGQARMAGQEMPKVNDAALMAMAPQAAPPQAPQGQGISSLPAPNMAGMADGGIAGYDDEDMGMADGGMFNFAQAGGPVMSMAGGGVPGYNGKQNSLIKYGGAYGGENILPATSGYEGMGIGEFLGAASSDLYNRVAPYLTPGSQEENVAERNKKRKKA